MSLRRVLAIAAFEARLARRMVRVWVLGLLAVILAVFPLAQNLIIHRLFSGLSGSYAFLTRDVFVLQPTIILALIMSLFGVFYVFDWRHRDAAARFSDTLDASPVRRLELAWGKFLGLLVPLVPPFLLLFVLQVIGAVVAKVPIAPSTVLVAYVAFAPLVLLVPIALCFGLAGLTGSRAVAILVSLTWIAFLAVAFGFFGRFFEIPEVISVVVAGAGTGLPLHSDFIGYEWDSLILAQEAMILIFIALLVTLGASGRLGLARSAGAKRQRLALTAGLAAAWLAGMAVVFTLYEGQASARREVIAAESAVVGAAAATVVTRDLEVDLTRRGRIAGRATLTVRNDTGSALDELHFRLNEGLDLDQVSKMAGAPVEFRRDHTVVSVSPASPLAPGDATELSFEYDGGIEAASIDGEEFLRTRELGASVRNTRRFLGITPAVLDRNVVALGLDAGWYPDPAMRFGHEYPERPTPSFAPGTLTVKLPEGWKAASAGRRTVEADGTHRFELDVPVAGLSLNAAEYEERSMEVAGITFRVLHHPDHDRNVEFFAEAAGLIEERIAERLDDVRHATGLEIPLPEMTLVEVPQTFQAFASGWDTPNRMSAPGVVMAREGGIFGARFEFAFEQAKKEFEKDSGGSMEATEDGVQVTVSIGGDDEEEAPGDESAETTGEGSEADETTAEGGEAAPGAGAGAEDAGESGEGDEDDDALSVFDPARAKLDILERFVGTDWTGGDVERLAVKSAWDHRLQAVGRGAPVAGHALSSHVSELALGRPTIDSPEVGRLFNDQGFNRIIQVTVRGRDEEMTDTVMEVLTDVDEIYARMVSIPLLEMDPEKEPVDFLGVLYLKGRKPLEALHDTLGRERWVRVLDTLLEEHGGSTFTWEDFQEAVLGAAPAEQRAELEVLFENWLEGTALPGFVVTRPRAWRLPGQDEQWQVVASVANRGTAAGPAKLRTGEGEGGRSQLVSVAPGEEVEVGMVTPRQPKTWVLEPYLALNRTEMRGSFRVLEEAPAAGPFEGVRPAEVHGEGEPVVVDNLDEGFTVTLEDGQEVAWAAMDEENEPRLPRVLFLRSPSKWSRWRSEGGWHRPFGIFDVTAAVKKGTEEADQPARWRSWLPESGTWRVEVSMPPSGGNAGKRLVDKWSFVVKSAGGAEEEIVIDKAASETGWNDLGRFQFEDEAEVVLEDSGEGVVVADAVRFVKESS